ncbi:hypothetical protein GF366_03270, partial [Candidatus Peregrinibacteria bacterium]|nr:hypothetical protein [Candidatus Peregrinibacteria bacterium]
MVTKRKPATSSPRGPEKVREFNRKVEKLSFDEENAKDQMFDILSKSRGFSLIKGEITGEIDPGGKKITKEMFEKYLLKNGGSRFVERIFNKGQEKLKRDFRRLKRKFRRYKRLMFRKGRVAENFQKSMLGKRLMEIAGGKENIKSLKFEDAYEKGFFNIR